MTPDEKASLALELVAKLASAITRRGTEQDGNWGWPKFSDEVREIEKTARAAYQGSRRMPKLTRYWLTAMMAVGAVALVLVGMSGGWGW